MTVLADFKKKDVDQLVKEITNDSNLNGRTVVICWEHSYIINLVRAFGYNSVPAAWDESVFDRTWILNFTGDHVSSFEDIPQKLLPATVRRNEQNRPQHQELLQNDC